MGDGVHGNKPTKQEEQKSVKRCSKCKETKAVSEFHKDKSRKDGLNACCKLCQKANTARWRAANPDYKAAWYAANKEKATAYSAEWQSANPEKRRAIQHRYRARKRKAQGTFTAADWKARLAYHGYRCVYCGVEKHETTEKYLTMEHLIPLSRGGTNWPSNLAPSCQSCNCSKGTRTHFEYLEYLNAKDI